MQLGPIVWFPSIWYRKQLGPTIGMSQHLTQDNHRDPEQEYPVSGQDSNPQTPECQEIHHSVSPLNQTQPLSTAIPGISNINTDVHIFSYQNRAVLQEERQRSWGHILHTALLQYIERKWHKCIMLHESSWGVKCRQQSCGFCFLA